MKFLGEDNSVVCIRESTRRKPMQIGIEDHQHQQAKYKGWEGSTHNTKHTSGLIDDAILMDSSLHSQPNANQDYWRDRPKSQIESIRETVLDQVSDRLRSNARVAKISEEDA